MNVEDNNLEYPPIEDDEGEEDLVDQQIITADRGQGPVRLDKFLLDRLNQVSRNKIQNGIRSGAILVNNKEVRPNYKVRPLDEISVVTPRHETVPLAAEPIPLDIIFEDEDLLVVNKQPGLVVHPGVGNRNGTLVNGLIHHLDQSKLPLLKGNPEDRPGLVHRIDKDTSGLLVIAKNDFTLSALARQFYHHSVKRTYQALVWGQPEPEEGTINLHIGRHPKNRLIQTTFPEGEQGRRAVTHFKVLEPLYYVSLVQCTLETGRTHQIRVHMQAIGHPLFNDYRYGGDRILKGTIFQKYRQFVENCFKMYPHQALHANTLGFKHPGTGEELLFQQELPEGFQMLLEKWRNYVNTRQH